MKPQEMKLEFVRLRAEGQSYDKIAEALHISKATCTAWERELKADITRLQQEGLNYCITLTAWRKRRVSAALVIPSAALTKPYRK